MPDALEIYWTPAARWALRTMPWRDAARVDHAVLLFAETGEGSLERVFEADPRALRLLVPPYAARLFLDWESSLLTVCWVSRAR